MSKPVTFAQLDQVLAELGFRKKVVPKHFATYEHAPSETMLVVRLHKSKEVVPWHVMAYVRVQLDGRGVIDAKDFDEMLHTPAA